MSMLTKFFKRLFTRSSRASSWSHWQGGWFGGTATAAGTRVTPNTALEVAAVWACVRVISETVGMIPLNIYRRDGAGGKYRASDHPLHHILHNEPNPEMTSTSFRTTLQAHILTHGNAYVEIVRNARGNPIALWPLQPDRVSIRRSERGMLEYRVQGDVGGVVSLQQHDVLHIQGLSGDGIVGYSPIRAARESIGLSLASEEYGASFFGNGALPGGILTHAGNLGEEAQGRLMRSWEKLHKGSGGAKKVAVLEEGMEWKPMSIPPEEAQFLQTRRFQVEEIARWYNVPLHVIQHLENATFSNIEHQSIEFTTRTIQPWLIRWEQELNRKLLGPRSRGDNGLFIEHLVDGLLRGDIKARYESYKTARYGGWMSANDIRRLENMNPIDGGDVYLVQSNMVPIDKVEECSRDGQAKTNNSENGQDGT